MAEEGFLGKPSSSEREATVHGNEDGGLYALPGITGTWGGMRDSMEESGVTLEAIYTGEFDKNFNANTASGTGEKKTGYQSNTDLTFTLDTEKAGMWDGGTLFIYGLGNTGRNPSDLTGDLQGYSNIAAPDQWIIQEAWYEQQFADGMLSVLAGLHDMNSEFYVSEYGSLFINSSFGIGPEVSNVAASLFPKAGLAARIRVNPTENTYIQTAIYDGDPATRGFKAAEGKMWITEAGMSNGASAYKVGYWKHTAAKTFDSQTFGNDYGMYGVVDQELMQLDYDGSIGAFLQYGYVPKSRNEIYTYIGAGLHIHGAVPTRVNDDLGVAIARADYHATRNAAKVSETAVELTYRLVATPWLVLQPSFEWIQNPGGNAVAPAVKVGLLRFEVTL